MELNLKIPASTEDIRSATQFFRQEIEIREHEIEVYGIAIDHYQKMCKHPEQETGHDGFTSWGKPCPVCGFAY